MANVKAHDAPIPQKAIDFLSGKVKVETEKWDDLKCGEHAHAFTVAHSAGAGIVDTMHKLMSDAVKNGMSFQEFRNQALDMMKKEGWYGGAGHTKEDEKYINWRIGVIYDTNMQTAYSQANYREQLEGVGLRPIWVYRHDPAVVNPRDDHLELDGKAFRYDDPFWDTYYPKNGWGCKCFVDTESEYSAEKAGIKVESSAGMELPEIDPTWAYNGGREALAPNFNKYQNIPKEALKEIQSVYHKSMEGTKLNVAEFKTLAKRTSEEDYKPLNVMYQVGNIEAKRFAAMQKAGVQDSKVMGTDSKLWHGTGDKNAGQKIPEERFDDLYAAFQEPDEIYEEIKPQKNYRTFHFVKNIQEGKKIKAVLYQKGLGKGYTALQLTTLGQGKYEYTNGKKYKRIW